MIYDKSINVKYVNCDDITKEEIRRLAALGYKKLHNYMYMKLDGFDADKWIDNYIFYEDLFYKYIPYDDIPIFRKDEILFALQNYPHCFRKNDEDKRWEKPIPIRLLNICFY